MRVVAGVLCIGGLDPGGGAGVAADVRAVAAAGSVAFPVVATLTVQSTRGLVSQQPISSSLLRAQAERVLHDQRVGALKTGALGSAANVRAVADLARRHPHLPLVVDPVRVPSRGRGALLDERGLRALARCLVPVATLVMANALEAAELTGLEVRDVRSARAAARALVELGARAALVKGGHLQDAAERGIDVLAVGGALVELRGRPLALPRVHGGGCIYASLAAGR